jgi:hypothetical protein
VGPVVGAVHHEGVVRDAEFIEQVQHLTHVLVMVNHCVVVGGLPAARLPQTRRLGVRAEVHVSGIQPAEEGLSFLVLLPDPVLRRSDELIVTSLHSLFGQRSGVLNLLLPDAPVTLVDSRILSVGCPAVQHAARRDLLIEFRKILLGWPIRQFRFLFRIQVVQVAEKFVEPMHGRQVFVAVSQMVLAELSGRVTQRLQQFGNRGILRL